ncbi:hypothetical protein [Hymenobacter sp. AT01-02]|uniref:hypothetical protein n=1 Tax=Hymenobacter sp. AT01-02 TaxID=1571877 RepID=UPI001F291DAB|nr:hypothetical protein [Hymenobacter sp. AT01-02]
MKKMILPALLATALLAAPVYAGQPVATKAAGTTKVADKTYKVQPQLSTLGWDGKAVTHGHNGTVQFSGGDLLVRGNQLVGGTVMVDMKTIKLPTSRTPKRTPSSWVTLRPTTSSACLLILPLPSKSRK